MPCPEPTVPLGLPRTPLPSKRAYRALGGACWSASTTRMTGMLKTNPQSLKWAQTRLTDLGAAKETAIKTVTALR
eukprot:scaffold3025_cov117-Cylindrotheca_fusiformis.AAC.1